MSDFDLQVRVVDAIGTAAGRAFSRYRLPTKLRNRWWQLEQFHALGFVEPDDWDELDLDFLIEPHPIRTETSSYPAALGHQLWMLMEVANGTGVANEARRTLEVAAKPTAPMASSGLNAALASMRQLAVPLARHSHRADLVGFLDDVYSLNVRSADPLLEQLTHAVTSIRPGDSPLLESIRESRRPLPRPGLAPNVEVDLAGPKFVFANPELKGSEEEAVTADATAEAVLVLPADSPHAGADEAPTEMDVGPFVNVGFAPGVHPTYKLPSSRLALDTLYWLWVQVGPRLDDALTGKSQPLSDDVLHGAEELEVAVFADDALEVSPSPVSGRLAVTHLGPFPVIRDAFPVGRLGIGDIGKHRLFFGVRTPRTSGVHRLRCALYARGLLVHVEQVTVPVGDVDSTTSVRTTFQLARTLSPGTFANVAEHRLSVYVNADPDGSHTFAFRGSNGEHSLSKGFNIGGEKVTTLLKVAREMMRVASWGTRFDYIRKGNRNYVPVSPGEPFATVTKVSDDLIQFALAGKELWLEFARKLYRGNIREMDKFESLMHDPGLVQLAPREDPDLLVPLQFLYDLPLATNKAGVSLCSATKAWLDAPTKELPCLEHPCLEAGDRTRVCAAGFWGLRHSISVTSVLRNECTRTSLATSVGAVGSPPALAGLTTDDEVSPFTATHLEKLRMRWTVDDQYDVSGVEAGLKAGRANLIYFLCHVKYEGPSPSIVVGPADGPGIKEGDLWDWKVDLCAGQPLVFLNACESAASSPERLLGLVDDFFMRGASAAVGTEITVFASMAVPFAENFLDHFAQNVELGEAIRRARVALLGAHNPLGLAYIAFGLPQLNLNGSPPGDR